MSDITLTAGVRQNLLSLQQTASDLTTTQEALATGKAVNSAAQNPSAYFTSQNLTNTANSLSALLDQVGQGQQTINAATNGLTGITSLLQQALSTVQQAQQTSQTAGATTGTVSIASSGSLIPASGGNLVISANGTNYTVSIAASSTLSSVEAAINGTSGLGASGAITASDNGSGDLVLTANNGSTSFTVDTSATATALGLTGASNVSVYGTSATRTTLQANYNGLLTQINQLASDSGYNGVNLLVGNNLTIDFNQAATSSLTITGVTYNYQGLGLATIAGSAAGSFQDNSALGTAVTNINNAINSVQTQTETFGTNSGVINTRQTFMTNMINTLQTGASNLVVYGSSATRTTLQANYNGLLTQINQLAADSGYNGVNLLIGNNLTIDFNQAGTSTLTITGVTYNYQGLGLAQIAGSNTGSFQDNNALGSTLTELNNAITQVQTQTETFGTNSGVIGTRQTFMTNMINTLQTGASNLVVADQNQESADLLTEQTQQQLEISALSIANQANQSVLKLFG